MKVVSNSSPLFDKLLGESELTEKEVDEIDHRVKRGIMESIGWK